VFLATGSQRLEAFRDLGRRGCRVICRRIDPPPAPFPFPGGAWTVGRPPFRVEDETRLFARLGIEFLVVRNAGGPASRPKLDAARALALPVLMIRRPAPPQDCRIAASVAEALDWVEGLT
jgi:precorrin-6A/cobalt-precorrin-6A reductase